MKYKWSVWGGLAIAGIGIALAVTLSILRHVETVDATDAVLRQVVTASGEFKAKFGTWPSALSDLTGNSKAVVFIDWGDSGPVDQWGNKIIYMPFSQEAGFGLTISWGADGKPGGVKQDRDRIMKIQ